MSHPPQGGPDVRGNAREAGYSPHTARLAAILALAYLLVIVYASLQPFRGWRAPPAEVLGFLLAPWPHYITLADVSVNFAAYVPLGLLLSLGWGARYGAVRGVTAAAAAAVLVSLLMEAVQMFLPARIASNVDLLANGLGALVGAMAAPLLAPPRALGVALRAARYRLFIDGTAADVGLVIVALWPLTQFHATVQPFGTGYYRATFELPALLDHSAWLAFTSEAVVALLSVLGVGLMLSGLMRRGTRPIGAIGAVIGVALLSKLFTAGVLVQAPSPVAWLTPGVVAGAIAAGSLLFVAGGLPHTARLAIAAVCILAATAAINLAPENPYQSIPPRLLARGASHFLSFSGIVRALSELWPLIAAGFLLHALARRGTGRI